MDGPYYNNPVLIGFHKTWNVEALIANRILLTILNRNQLMSAVEFFLSWDPKLKISLLNLREVSILWIQNGLGKPNLSKMFPPPLSWYIKHGSRGANQKRVGEKDWPGYLPEKWVEYVAHKLAHCCSPSFTNSWSISQIWGHKFYCLDCLDNEGSNDFFFSTVSILSEKLFVENRPKLVCLKGRVAL